MIPSLDHLQKAYALTSQATQITPLLESMSAEVTFCPGGKDCLHSRSRCARACILALVPAWSVTI